MPAATKLRVLPPEAYTVALICPLEVEMIAARCMLDEEHSQSCSPRGDPNQYVLGQVSGHNVVIASLPGHKGTTSAAVLSGNLIRTFPGISMGLVVGVAGGVPSHTQDVRLGDVAVSFPTATHTGTVEYDIGKQTPTGFMRMESRASLHPPPSELLSALDKLQSAHRIRPHKYGEFIGHMLRQYPALKQNYQRPPTRTDVLFPSNYIHRSAASTCESCDLSKAVKRPARDYSRVHYGLIASGSRVMKDAIERDRISADLGRVVCFEMEAAGSMNDLGCVIIRGISNYADSHKNDIWQPYAAAAAAAFAKEMLQYLETQEQVPSGHICITPGIWITIRQKIVFSWTERGLIYGWLSAIVVGLSYLFVLSMFNLLL